MYVLDLFAGRGTMSAAFRDAGHDVVTLDYDPAFGCDLTMDIRAFASDPRRYLAEARGDEWAPDVCVLGPPCEGFSVGAIGKTWRKDSHPPHPRTRTARLGLAFMLAGLRVVEVLDVPFWLMENPTGKMRVVMRDLFGIEPLAHPSRPRFKPNGRPDPENYDAPTTTYCRYGFHYRKAEDFWGRVPDGFALEPPCRAHPRHGTTTGVFPRSDGSVAEMTFANDPDGKPCHEAASRGAKTGTQGLANYEERSLLPHGIGAALLRAVQSGTPAPSVPLRIRDSARGRLQPRRGQIRLTDVTA